MNMSHALVLHRNAVVYIDCAPVLHLTHIIFSCDVLLPPHKFYYFPLFLVNGIHVMSNLPIFILSRNGSIC